MEEDENLDSNSDQQENLVVIDNGFKFENLPSVAFRNILSFFAHQREAQPYAHYSMAYGDDINDDTV